ncbi:MAG TPA: Sec-independent protein translocase protein TatB [Kofleriaceae bacterium]|nr:Sec-independent protein translocase protein TatB [Kofleriaceae bacterium]
MFGMGGSEILVILIVALIFLGPEKLPDAATKISKGIRELRRQTREVQQTIENDTEIGGAIRDLKSALRGDEIRPKLKQALAPVTDELDGAAKTLKDASNPTVRPERSPEGAESKDEVAESKEAAPPPEPRILPPEAGEHHDPDAPPPTAEEDEDLAKMIKPAPGTVAHGTKTAGHG